MKTCRTPLCRTAICIPLLWAAACSAPDADLTTLDPAPEDTPTAPSEAASSAPEGRGSDESHHFLHGERHLKLSFDGVQGRSIRLTLANTSSAPIDVELQATIRTPASTEEVRLPPIALEANESTTAALADADESWARRLGADQIGEIQLRASALLPEGGIDQVNDTLYFSSDFSVRTEDEVQELKRRLVDEPEYRSVFLRAGARPATPEEVERSRARSAQVDVALPNLLRAEDELLPSALDEAIRARLKTKPATLLDRATNGVRQTLSQGGAQVNARLCFNIGVEWDDDNVGEDFLTGGFWTAMGLSIWVRPEGATQFQGPYFTGPYNGEPIGCTQAISLENGSEPLVAIQSIARLPAAYDGNMNNRVQIVVDDPDSGPIGFSDQYEPVTIGGAGENWYHVTAANEEIRVVHAASTALQLLRDQRPGVSQLNIATNRPSSVGGAGGVSIAVNDDRRKFLIAHEVGHFVQQVNTGGGVAADYSETGPAACASGPTTGWFSAREWMNAALSEGWATFFAAAAFNQRSSTGGCRVGWNTMYDCEGTLSFVTAIHKNVCGGDSGHGVEWDWVRFSGTCTKPSLSPTWPLSCVPLPV